MEICYWNWCETSHITITRRTIVLVTQATIQRKPHIYFNKPLTSPYPWWRNKRVNPSWNKLQLCPVDHHKLCQYGDLVQSFFFVFVCLLSNAMQLEKFCEWPFNATQSHYYITKRWNVVALESAWNATKVTCTVYDTTGDFTCHLKFESETGGRGAPNAFCTRNTK